MTLFFGNRLSFKRFNLWHFKILTWESMESPKLCNILKTADRTVKRTSGPRNSICWVIFIIRFNFNQTLWKVWESRGNTGYYFLGASANFFLKKFVAL